MGKRKTNKGKEEIKKPHGGTLETTEKKQQKSPRIFSVSSLPAYFRELSIVIVGVLVTLSITSTINSCTRQNEINGMLKFVKTELEESLENVEWAQGRWEGEQHIFRLVRENREHPASIPVDTLRNYQYAIGNIYGLAIKNESYELLKTSMLMQYVEDKDLLRTLARTYGELQGLKGQLARYSEQKQTLFLEPLMITMSEDEIKQLGSGDPLEMFTFVAHKEEFVKFVYVGESILSPSSIFEDCKKSIRECIRLMEKKNL